MVDSLNILLATIGSPGDVLPFIYLGKTLKQRGHSVSLATHPTFAPTVQKSGLDFSPLGTEEEYQQGLLDPKLFHPREAFATLSRLAILPLIKPVYEFIQSRYEHGRTRVIALPHCFGARLAQEKMGVPLASIVLQPCVFRSLHHTPQLPGFPAWSWTPTFVKKFFYERLTQKTDHILGSKLNEFRREIGLAPVSRILAQWRYSPQLVLGLFPSWFAEPQPDWLPQIRLADFPFDPDPPEPLPPLVHSFLSAGDAPIVFSPGSAMRHHRPFFEEALATCLHLNRRAIFLTPFAEQLPSSLPPSILHVSWVSLKALLPRCAAIVHSAGIGIGSVALAMGIPQIVIPLAYDQPDNAERFKRLQTTIVIQQKSGALTPALKRLLEDPTYSNAAKKARERLRDPDPFARPCKWIEGMESSTSA